jgi:oligoendopeptidase F
MLPSWNLQDLYNGIKDPKIQQDIQRLETEVATFAAQYEGQLTTLNALQFAKSLSTYEQISMDLAKLYIYAELLFTQDSSITEHVNFLQSTKETVNEMSVKTIFYTLEMNDVSEEILKDFMHESTALARYKPWLDQVRAFKPYSLSKDIEKILHEKSIASCSNWQRLFEETFGGLTVDVQGEKKTISETLNLLGSPDGSKREAAAHGFAKVLQQNINLFSLIYNTIIKDKEIEDRWRKYASPISSRNLANQVEDEVVETLISTVKQNYSNLSHRYYTLKAKWLGQRKLAYWDRNAPLPGGDEHTIPWEEAKDIVLQAYQEFSPEMAKIAKMFFDKNWIDAGLNPAKDNGAFSHPCIPTVHPYILLNYHGKMRDVMTLAHELGHGIHQVLSAEQGFLLSDVPLTLAETASVFGEMLTFQSLLKKTKSTMQRRRLLASKVEDMLNTTVRQIAFSEFETAVHAARSEGELSPEQLGEIFIRNQQESLGPIFDFAPEYQYYWSYVSHFIRTPFYVYAYAFGDCLVNSLYARYLEGHPSFVEKYLHMLKAGGTLRHKEMLAPFNLDANDPQFWQRGLNLIHQFIDELEELSK